MRGNIERWLTGRKSLLAIPVMLVLVVATWSWLRSPPQSAVKAERSPQIQAQWRKLLPLRNALQAVRVDEARTEVFSPIALPVAEAALIAWRPMGAGGELQLGVEWRAVPALFSWLARCGMRATAFTIEAEKQALLLTLHLEAEDAP